MIRSFLRSALRWLLLCCLGLAAAAHAGRSCEAEQPPRAETVLRGLQLAERTRAALDASGAEVVVLARAGQDLGRYGLHYSHLGFAYRAPDGRGGQAWRVLHKLNQCGTREADLYVQGLGQFFLDDLWRYEAAWVVPTPAVQARLLALLRDRTRATRLQHRPYSIVSYAWGSGYQQSNQWAIETLALALDDSASSREKAQAWLRLRGYEPAVLQIDALTRLGARLARANVAFDDHPVGERMAGRIATVTVDSVFAWLQRAQLGGAPVTLSED